MENFTLKSCFIFDPTLKSKKRKPSDDEIQDIKLLYYYPNSEDKVIKRSNMGIVEGTTSFLSAFTTINTENHSQNHSQNHTQDHNTHTEKFLLVELNKCYYISNKVEDNCYIAFILQKQTSTEFSYYQNIETKKKWFKSLISNFYDTYILFNGLIKDQFFKTLQKNPHDIREIEEEYKILTQSINDFIENYFEILPQSKIPFLDNILYFPLNEISHSQLLLATQRLHEKV